MSERNPPIPKRAVAAWSGPGVLLMTLLLQLVAAAPSSAQVQVILNAEPAKPTLEIYGFAQADAIVDFLQNNPDWYDVNRPTKLPNTADQFGANGHFYLSPRASRFGVKGNLPTGNGDVKGTFEFDMFGVGQDAGQTTIRLRQAWGQWKQVGAGQTNSAFMDVDVFPNVLDYWGPNGMLFFRNVQVFWEPYNDGNSNARIAIEAPGASGDGGAFSDRVELQSESLQPHYPAPDLTGHARWGGKGGDYLQVGAALRYIGYHDSLQDQFDLSGNVWGWGLSVSSALKGKSNTVHLQLVYGEGIENYFNDAPIDVAVKTNFGNPVTPIVGEALPALGLVAFLDHNWSEKWSSAVGYSRVDIDNSNGQAGDAFKTGQYSVVNLLCVPVTNVLMGGEFQWARRDNNFDGFSVNDYRVQFTFKYSFSGKVGG